MTRKPNFVKFMLGVLVLALLFIGAWATTSARLTNAKKVTAPTDKSAVTNNSTTAPYLSNSLALPAGDSIFDVFELDGDILDSPAGAPDDWTAINCNGGNADVKTGVIFDGLGPTVFTTGGSKDDLDISSWKHKTDQNSPPKDEILNAYAAKYTGSPSGDTILTFGADKYDTSGTAFIGAWFFKNTVVAAEDGKFRTALLADDPDAPLATHSVGDVLVLLNFPGGGTNFAIKQVFEWVGVGGTCDPPATLVNGTLCNITATGQADSVEGLSNLTIGPLTIPDTCPSWVHTPKDGPDQTIQTNAFFEGAINISDFPALDACFSSFLLETRASDSVSATLKDFVLGSFDTCPEVTITKSADDTNICAGTATTYTYKVTNPTNFTLSGTVVDDNETQSTADDLDVTLSCAAIGGGSPQSVSLPPGDKTFTCTRTLAVGTHTNTVTVIASFGGFSDTATATETVVVNANPNMSIDNFTCNTTGFASTLTATDANNTGATLSWTKNGSFFAGNVSSIDVTMPGVYVVTATTSASCTGTATRIVGICTTCSP